MQSNYSYSFYIYIACLLTYMQSYIHTYIHILIKYIHSYIHTYNCLGSLSERLSREDMSLVLPTLRLSNILTDYLTHSNTHWLTLLLLTHSLTHSFIHSHSFTQRCTFICLFFCMCYSYARINVRVDGCIYIKYGCVFVFGCLFKCINIFIDELPQSWEELYILRYVSFWCHVVEIWLNYPISIKPVIRCGSNSVKDDVHHFLVIR